MRYCLKTKSRQSETTVPILLKPLGMDEIVKLSWLCSRYKKFIWLKNLKREEETAKFENK